MNYLYFLIFLALSYAVVTSKKDSESNENLYVFKTKHGDIKSNYHDSRDDYDTGQFQYVDAITKERKYIKISDIDSIIIINENFWTCGPKRKSIKYINSK